MPANYSKMAAERAKKTSKKGSEELQYRINKEDFEKLIPVVKRILRMVLEDELDPKVYSVFFNIQGFSEFFEGSDTPGGASRLQIMRQEIDKEKAGVRESDGTTLQPSMSTWLTSKQNTVIIKNREDVQGRDQLNEDTGIVYIQEHPNTSTLQKIARTCPNLHSIIIPSSVYKHKLTKKGQEIIKQENLNVITGHIVRRPSKKDSPFFEFKVSTKE